MVFFKNCGEITTKKLRVADGCDSQVTEEEEVAYSSTRAQVNCMTKVSISMPSIICNPRSIYRNCPCVFYGVTLGPYVELTGDLMKLCPLFFNFLAI